MTSPVVAAAPRIVETVALRNGFFDNRTPSPRSPAPRAPGRATEGVLGVSPPARSVERPYGNAILGALARC